MHFTNAVPAAHKQFRFVFRAPVSTLGLASMSAQQTTTTNQNWGRRDCLPLCVGSESSQLFGKAVEYYYRMLPFLSRARQLATGGLSKDLSLRETQHMVG